MSWTGEPEKPAVALGGHATRSVRRLPWRSLVVGLAVGALVASGAVAVVLRPTGSASAGRLVELSYGFVGPFTPVTVAGTTTTSCVYAPDDMIGLQGQTASDLIDHLIATGPAAGKLACVRRGAGRLFSVQLSGTGVSSDSPAAAAFQMASAVDHVWEELVSR